MLRQNPSYHRNEIPLKPELVLNILLHNDHQLNSFLPLGCSVAVEWRGILPMSTLWRTHSFFFFFLSLSRYALKVKICLVYDVENILVERCTLSCVWSDLQLIKQCSFSEWNGAMLCYSREIPACELLGFLVSYFLKMRIRSKIKACTLVWCSLTPPSFATIFGPVLITYLPP